MGTLKRFRDGHRISVRFAYNIWATRWALRGRDVGRHGAVLGCRRRNSVERLGPRRARPGRQEIRPDWEEFQDRHELASPAFETGRIPLDTYLQRTVLYRKRSFTREEFTHFMFAQSEEFPESRRVLADVASTGNYLQATLNNEPLELNERRIHEFNLRRELKAFSAPVI